MADEKTFRVKLMDDGYGYGELFDEVQSAGWRLLLEVIGRDFRLIVVEGQTALPGMSDDGSVYRGALACCSGQGVSGEHLDRTARTLRVRMVNAGLMGEEIESGR